MDPEVFGPSSQPVDIAAFRQSINADAYLPATEQKGRLASLSDDQRQWLANRLDVGDLRIVGDRVYRRPQKVIELDIWQKARYLAGSDDEHALATMQEKIQGPLKLGVASGAAKRAKKQLARGKRKAEEPDDVLDPSLQGDEAPEVLHQETPVEALRRARTAISQTPGPATGNAIKPASDIMPDGLEIYRPFAEAQHYIRWTRKTENNTLLGPRLHARGYAGEWGMSSQEMSSGPICDDDPGPALSEGPLLVLNFTYHASTTFPRTARHVELAMLSTQTLAELADALLCPSDAIPAAAPAGLRQAGRPQRYGKGPASKGTVMLIENTIYSDTRPGRSDLAQVLRSQFEQIDWATRGKFPDSQVNDDILPDYNYSDTSLQDMRLGDLTLRIGQPYWLVHQGNCEHIFTLDAVRVVHPHDKMPLDGPACPYPLTTMVSRLGADKCRICNRDPATRTLIDDELAGDSPTLTCDICFHYLHGNGGELSLDPAERQVQQEEAEVAARTLGVEVIPILESLRLR